jgi:hypothetical protein
MMGGAPQDPGAEGRFNGVVQTDEGNVQVQNGVAQIGGDVYFVSDDGTLVVDKNQKLVAVIQNGKAMPVTPEIADQLKQSGIAQ